MDNKKLIEKPLTAKSGWRPAVAWTYLLICLIVVCTVCYLLFIDKAKLADAVIILSAIITTLGTNAGLYVHNRTKEKLMDKQADDEENF